MNISICTDALYQGVETIEAMEEVKAMGLDTIEFWTWWDKDLGAIKRSKDRLGMTISTFCTKFISLVDESKRDAYIEGLKETIEAAKYLEVKKIITQVGDALPLDRKIQKKVLIDGLKACVPYLEAADMTLMIEPLNILVDHQGYFLYSSAEAFEIIEAVDSPYVKVIFDVYHQQITEGNLINNIQSNIDKIAHFHTAGHPGRHELQTGEINYKSIFETIDLSGYRDFVGFEYFPKERPEVGILPFLK